jgi:hypothetical protein
MGQFFAKLSLRANKKSVKKNAASEIDAKAGEKCRAQRHKAAVAAAALKIFSLDKALIKIRCKFKAQHT